MNSKTIRDHVVEAGRYDQAMSLLDGETKEYQENPMGTYPLVFSTDRVTGLDIFTGLTVTQMVINASDRDSAIDIIANLDEESSNSIRHASDWVQSNTRMYLHNYANTISHRKSDFDPNMDTIRLWLVIQTVIEFIADFISCMEDDEFDPLAEFDTFYIPKGWWVDPMDQN